MTKKELIAKIKSKSYEDTVKTTVKMLTGIGYKEAAQIVENLYEDLKELTKVDSKASSKYFEDPDLDSAFCDYVSMRTKIKKPLTLKALSRAMIKLEDLSHGDKNLKIEILNQSTDNCWAGIFPLREEKSFERNQRNPQQSQLNAILGSISND